MEDDRDCLVDQFVNITGVDKDRAKFFLESSAWNLEIAMASFYEEGDDASHVFTDSPQRQEEEPEDTSLFSVPTPQPQKQNSKGTFGGNSSRFATITNFSEDADSDEEGQAFYAGGSERSGQQVLGPPKHKGDVVESLFKAAKEHGAEVVDKDTHSKKARGPAFRGTGYRLGDTEGVSDVVQETSSASSKPREVSVVLKMWKKGFSVGDGSLRNYGDPENKDFLDSITKGEIPAELLRLAKGGTINLNMEDHRHEDYVKPRTSMHAFGGAGHILGSPAPTVLFSAGSSSCSNAAANEPKLSAGQTVEVNPAKPTTTLQIRLADGSRLSVKLNTNHKVRDIRKYIVMSHPQYNDVTFTLMTTFPNKELTDGEQTLAEANLLNAVIMQRIK